MAELDLTLLATSRRPSAAIATDRAVTLAAWLFGLAAVALPLGIIAFLALRGARVLSWEFLTAGPAGFPLGAAGGVGPAVLGTLALVGGGLLVALPLGIGGGLFLNEYAARSRWVKVVRFTAECLAGIPAVIYGLFGYSLLVVFLSLKISLLAGAITLGLVMFPIILIGTQDSLAAVEDEYREAALALGVSRSYAIRRILLPKAWPGIVAVMMLASGHAAGSAAPVMYTASTVLTRGGLSLDTPVMTLPTHLYHLIAEAVSFEHAYGTALVLVLGMLCGNALALPLRRRRS
jgi:phosphate transport system permease protein